MSGYPTISPARRLELLEPPQGPVDAVLDTDTYNEIDDQFALVYALLSPEKIRLEAVYAAPFFNERSSGPADGMERSYEEILRVMTHLGFDPTGMVYRGSTGYLPAKGTPCESDAASDLIARARAPRSGPLYVMTIGAITNVASALLMAMPTVPALVHVGAATLPLGGVLSTTTLALASSAPPGFSTTTRKVWGPSASRVVFHFQRNSASPSARSASST